MYNYLNKEKFRTIEKNTDFPLGIWETWLGPRVCGGEQKLCGDEVAGGD